MALLPLSVSTKSSWRARPTRPCLCSTIRSDGLRADAHGAVVVDWDRAAREIEGVKVLMCSASLATRLRDATRRCWPRPTIAFAQPEKMRHAA